MNGLRVARRPTSWLIAVSVAYLLLQLVTMNRNGFSWDETVSLSQVTHHVPPAFFSAPRARGMSWLAAPVAMWTRHPMPTKVYLAILASAALVAAYWPWLRLLRPRAAVLGAALFALLWPTLYYGSQVIPNLWVGFGSAFAVGWYLRAQASERRRWPLVGAGAGIATAALMRPSDSAWLTLALLVATLAVPGWRRLGNLTAVVAGTVLGWLPWLVESYLRFGGIVHRLHTASHIEGGTTPRLSLFTELSAVNGPELCRPCHQAVPASAASLWAIGGLLVVIAVAAALRRRRGSGVLLLATLTGVSLAMPYVALIYYAAPRFLLPAYSLLVIPVAAGILDLLGARPSHGTVRRLAAGGLVAAGMAVLAVYQLRVLDTAQIALREYNNQWLTVAATLGHDGFHAPCVVTGDNGPPLGWYTDCSSRNYYGNEKSISVSGLRALTATRHVALVLKPVRPPPRWARTWRHVVVRPPHSSPFSIYLS